MKLLIIGALEGHITTASKIALARGAKVVNMQSIPQALNDLRNGNSADLIMIDVSLDIAGFIKSLNTERIHVQVVACGIGSATKEAVAAIRAGAKEYIPLPPDADLIAAVLEAVTEEPHTMIGSDESMVQVKQLAQQFAPSEATVLITGESGVGKEIMARFLHNQSRRSDKPFVSINCAAIPENLLESELFGHEKGAFTGAVSRRIGKFEEANNGTLLLDEIGEMDLRLQAKLLRVIQEREVDRVGGTKPVPVNIRLIATTNRNLMDEVQDGNFREDLYFRLNVVNLVVPPLRERPQDIQQLSEHFCKKYSKANGLEDKAISEAALTKLKSYTWKGNVRELENTMHRAVLLSNDTEIEESAVLLTSEMTTGHVRGSEGGIFKKTASSRSETGIETSESSSQPYTRQSYTEEPFVGRTVADVERELIINTLDHCLGNRTHAAHVLGISIRTLRNKLKQYTDDGHSVPTPQAS